MVNARRNDKKRRKPQRPTPTKENKQKSIIVISLLFIGAFALALVTQNYFFKDEKPKEPQKIDNNKKELELKNQELLSKLNETLKKNEQLQKELNKSILEPKAEKISMEESPGKLPKPPSEPNEILPTIAESLQESHKQNGHDYLSEIKDYEKSEQLAKKITAKKEKKQKLTLKDGEKPKLVIIIDDVGTKAQLDSIKKLGLKITPSFFPPSEYSPGTDRLALESTHYMIHLPLEAHGFNNKERHTLKTTSSFGEIDSRIRSLKAFFPDAKFINNHTGSKFTENERSMGLLFDALSRYGFIFVDSRTTPNSKVSELSEKLKTKYFSRDVFLDNNPDVHYIKSQLKVATQKAKENGYAIAIGHPHNATFRALADASEILSEVELVYLDELNL